MTIVVSTQEAKTHLSRLLTQVERGDEVVIARHGRQVAKLVALAPAPARELGFMPLALDDEADAALLAPLDDDALAWWEGHHASPA
ncbi:MAG: type II toxin-antitoxin system prevent-host-death family antitoxin [Micrococcales bacterium]|nr:type II toxin-antitoxin system prevent-host-death family antitoxin [Micrococcales bacterium]